MQKIVKVRAINRSKFLSVPKSLAEEIHASYMKVRLDEFGRLIYAPVPESGCEDVKENSSSVASGGRAGSRAE